MKTFTLLVFLLVAVMHCSAGPPNNETRAISILLDDTLPCKGELDAYAISQKYVWWKTRYEPNAVDLGYPIFLNDAPTVLIYSKRAENKGDETYTLYRADYAGNTFDNFGSSYRNSDIISVSRSSILLRESNGDIVRYNKDGLQRIKLPSLKPSAKEIFSPDGVFCLYAKNQKIYRYNLIQNKTDSITGNVPDAYMADCSKTGKVAITEFTNYADDTTYLAVYNARMELEKRMAFAATKKGYAFSFQCIRFNPANDNEIFYLAQDGIYRLNLKSGETLMIKENCLYKGITSFTVSPDGKCLAAQINVPNYYTDGTQSHYSRIMLINLTDFATSLINPEM